MPKKPAETAMGVHDLANLLDGMARHNEGLPDRLRHILSPVTIGLLPPNACVSLPPESVAVVRDCLRDFQDCPDRQAETWAWAVVAHIRDRQISNIHTDLKFRHPDLAAMWRSPGDIVIASLPHDLQQRVLTPPLCGEDFVRAWIGEIPVLDIMGKVYDLAPKWQEWAKVNGLHPAHQHEASAGQGTAWVLPGAVVPVGRDVEGAPAPEQDKTKRTLAGDIGAQSWAEIEMRVLATGVDYRLAGTNGDYTRKTWGALGLKGKLKVYGLLISVAKHGGTYPRRTEEPSRRDVVFDLNEAFCGKFGLTDRPFGNSKRLGTQSVIGSITWGGQA